MGHSHHQPARVGRVTWYQQLLCCAAYRKRWTRRAVRLWAIEWFSGFSQQNPDDQIMVLTGLLKIANSLVIIHTTQTVRRTELRCLLWKPLKSKLLGHISFLCEWTEVDWVWRGSFFYKSKECGFPALDTPNLPKLPPLRAKWSRFALCIQNSSFCKSLNTGKVKWNIPTHT